MPHRAIAFGRANRLSPFAFAAGIVAVPLLATWIAHASDERSGQSRLAVIRPAPEFKLTDQLGNELRMSELRGKIVLVSFIFTTCNGSCPATTHRMSLVQRELQSRGLFSKSQV